ncbi:flagellin domain-containing protein, partial [mine drainage metagenome]
MFVNTNVAALNAWLNLSNTQNSMTSILQQLSSGLKINSAANNPAGLAISQQMQSEISGMNQAYQNSQTAINLFQTADSALGSIQSILQSMRSLASQASTSTNNSTDLQALQSEMNQYAQQITQISNDTNFNTL